MSKAAPPKSAAVPTPPVFIGIAAPELELLLADAVLEAEEAAALACEVGPSVLMLLVGVGTPLVNGTLVPVDDALLNAGV